MMRILTVLLLVFLISGNLFSQDLVEWRGPNRTGNYPDQNLLKSWPEKGPQLLLELKDIGNGYSSPIVYKNTIYVTGRKDTLDFVSAYEMNGATKWETAYGRAWARSFPETRCTPTIENNRIYLVSGMGQVGCVDAISGKLIWTADAKSVYKGEPHRWGVAESVAISDKAVFYVTGGEETSVIALDKTTGQLIWKTRSMGGTSAYASSVIIEKAGMKLLLAQTANDLMAVNIENGEIIWSYNLAQHQSGETGKGGNTNTPLFLNNEIFVTSGYDHPALMLSLANDGRSVSLKWTNADFDCHLGGVVKLDKYIFGSNWINNTSGNWICVDWETGKTHYNTSWFNKGSIISADGLLYCYEEKSGNLALVRPNPEKFEVISSFKIHQGVGPHWAHPSIYDGKLLVRHGESLMVYELRKEVSKVN
ncbi:MAG TPA: alcohol dehydrogenase [Prolixibacteraceae bacterium]|jgi:outer membrane protein assembly factor BamB|nr:alcohol dehydrogenase [Prolixibacteraceae bacterium]